MIKIIVYQRWGKRSNGQGTQGMFLGCENIPLIIKVIT